MNSNDKSSKSFLVYVIAENTERGLVSAKRMSQALTLSPSLYQAKGTGPSTDGLDDVILKKALGPNSNVKNIGKPTLKISENSKKLKKKIQIQIMT